MMSTLREYCEKLSTEQLEDVIRADYIGEVHYPAEVILAVCEVLAQRKPNKSDVPEAYRRFREMYLP